MNIPSNILTMLAGIVLTLVSLWYGQNHGLLPIAASDEALMIDGLFNTMMTISVGLVLLVQGILVICLFRFRRQPNDHSDGPPIHGNVPLEIVWTAIPAIIVLIIGVYSFDVYKSLGGFDPHAAHDAGVSYEVTQVALLPGEDAVSPLLPPNKSSASTPIAAGIGAFPDDENQVADLVVNVMGLQYAWIFTYPGGITTGELHTPVGREVQLNINAQDVIHAFWLPEFRLKQDAIPGRTTELRFKPQRPGEYPIVCAELCGAYHGAMAAKIYVEPTEVFDHWLQGQIAARDDGTAIALAPPASGDRSDADYLSRIATTLQTEIPVTPHLLESLPSPNLLPDSLTTVNAALP